MCWHPSCATCMLLTGEIVTLLSLIVNVQEVGVGGVPGQSQGQGRS